MLMSMNPEFGSFGNRLGKGAIENEFDRPATGEYNLETADLKYGTYVINVGGGSTKSIIRQGRLRDRKDTIQDSRTVLSPTIIGVRQHVTSSLSPKKLRPTQDPPLFPAFDPISMNSSSSYFDGLDGEHDAGVIGGGRYSRNPTRDGSIRREYRSMQDLHMPPSSSSFNPHDSSADVQLITDVYAKVHMADRERRATPNIVPRERRSDRTVETLLQSVARATLQPVKVVKAAQSRPLKEGEKEKEKETPVHKIAQATLANFARLEREQKSPMKAKKAAHDFENCFQCQHGSCFQSADADSIASNLAERLARVQTKFGSDYIAVADMLARMAEYQGMGAPEDLEQAVADADAGEDHSESDDDSDDDDDDSDDGLLKDVKSGAKKDSKKEVKKEESEESSKEDWRNARDVWDAVSYKRFHKIPPEAKLFVIGGQFGTIRQGLLDRGYVEIPDRDSHLFDFRWTASEKLRDIMDLRDDQITNHFGRMHEIATKEGIYRNLKCLRWTDGFDYSKFFPRCFLMDGTGSEFSTHYAMIEAEILLKNHFLNLQNGKSPVNTHLVKAAVSVCQKYIRKLRFHQSILKSKYVCEYNPTYRVSAHGDGKPWDWFLKDIDVLDASIKDWSHELLTCITALTAEEKILFLSETPLPHARKPLKRSREATVAIVPEKKSPVPPIAALKKQPYAPCADDFLVDELAFQTLAELSVINPQFAMNGLHNAWILKPARSSRGRGIHCFNKASEIFGHTSVRRTKFVAQKYIENPLLWEGKKFDIRQWVLITSWNPLVLWFYDDCYVRMSTECYSPHSLSDRYAHLCNRAVQKRNGGYDEVEGNIRSQEELVGFLEGVEADCWLSKIQPQMKRYIILSLSSGQDFIRSRKNSFELLGFDFMIDDLMNPWFIEINTSPDLARATPVLDDVVSHGLDGLLQVVLDGPGRNARLGRNIGGWSCILNKSIPAEKRRWRRNMKLLERRKGAELSAKDLS